jgi:hypothetical protein
MKYQTKQFINFIVFLCLIIITSISFFLKHISADCFHISNLLCLVLFEFYNIGVKVKK